MCRSFFLALVGPEPDLYICSTPLDIELESNIGLSGLEFLLGVYFYIAACKNIHSSMYRNSFHPNSIFSKNILTKNMN